MSSSAKRGIDKRRAEREAEAAAHAKSIVTVGEDDVGCHYLLDRQPTEREQGEDPNRRSAFSPTLDVIGTRSSLPAMTGHYVWSGTIMCRASEFGEKSATLHGHFDIEDTVPDCRMRATLVAGTSLERVPEELGLMCTVALKDVIEYLLTAEAITVVEFDPEGADDEETYTHLSETMVRDRRAGVILDTPTMLMYLIPPLDEAGQLLQPPADTCANMLGVLVVVPQHSAAGA